MKKIILSTVAVLSLNLMAGCAGGGGYGGGYNNNPYGSAPAQSASSALGSAAGAAMGGGVQGALVNAIIQSMAASVLNGQIGSQLAPADQNFRLQQLGGAVQSGSINQAQQWLNPQTGNSVTLTPLGQQTVDPASGQNCRELEEVVTLQDGRTLREARRICQNASSQWVLVQ